MQGCNSVNVLCIHVEVTTIDKQLYCFTAGACGCNVLSLPIIDCSIIVDVGEIAAGKMEWSEFLFSRLGIWVCGY